MFSRLGSGGSGHFLFEAPNFMEPLVKGPNEVVAKLLKAEASYIDRSIFAQPCII